MLQLVLDISVPDVTRTVEFYRDVLGFELVSVRGRGERMHAQVRAGQVDLMFRSSDVHEPLLGSLQERVPNERWHFQVEDIYALYDRVRRSGKPIRFLRRLEPSLFGTAEFAIEDVDGRPLYFSQSAGVARTPQ